MDAARTFFVNAIFVPPKIHILLIGNESAAREESDRRIFTDYEIDYDEFSLANSEKIIRIKD
jgi:hypothetical protein